MICHIFLPIWYFLDNYICSGTIMLIFIIYSHRQCVKSEAVLFLKRLNVTVYSENQNITVGHINNKLIFYSTFMFYSGTEITRIFTQLFGTLRWVERSKPSLAPSRWVNCYFKFWLFQSICISVGVQKVTWNQQKIFLTQRFQPLKLYRTLLYVVIDVCQTYTLQKLY